jgi:flagellar motility protein MotE (MotC chaperone)
MIRFIRDLRLLPIALIASACLLALKTADLVLDTGGYVMLTGASPVAEDGDAAVVRAMPDGAQPNDRQRSWAQQMLNFPGSSHASTRAAPAPIASPPLVDKVNTDIMGLVLAEGDRPAPEASDDRVGAVDNDEKDGSPANDGKDGKEAKDGKDAKNGKEAKGSKEARPATGAAMPADGATPPSGAERAILERLQQRRQELDTRARELDIREGLIAAAEKRVEARLAELKAVEAQITVASKKEEAEAARFKGLVIMYESMKPRDAAKIFDRLEVAVLLEVASQINPRRMADILALMAPETAQRLTVELATRAQAAAKGGTGDLPKVEGRPTTP